YLGENQGKVPPYLVVSHVWGKITKEKIQPGRDWGTPWSIPISDPEKLKRILQYCETTKVKWMWMDILCTNQARDNQAKREKAQEVAKMGHYYREATACLVIPVNYEEFN
ncbi:hypothetical protein M404DRAFT_59964, partial [Pisolithus tinctorius Marx 270]